MKVRVIGAGGAHGEQIDRRCPTDSEESIRVGTYVGARLDGPARPVVVLDQIPPDPLTIGAHRPDVRRGDRLDRIQRGRPPLWVGAGYVRPVEAVVVLDERVLDE